MGASLYHMLKQAEKAFEVEKWPFVNKGSLPELQKNLILSYAVKNPILGSALKFHAADYILGEYATHFEFNFSGLEAKSIETSITELNSVNAGIKRLLPRRKDKVHN